MTSQREPGILAIWNDCRAGGEAEYEAWYRGEHLRERVGLPGFRFGRRLVSLDGASPRYFSYYETETVGVLSSPVYLERGTNPTQMTRHIMTNVFRNMNRTVCRRVRTIGDINGPYAITVRADAAAAGNLAATFDRLAGLPERLRAELWLSAEDPAAAPSNEERIRGKDAKIAACVLVNFSDVEHTTAAATAARSICGSGCSIELFRLINALDHQDIAR